MNSAPTSTAPFGEIRIFAGLTPPKGWLICDGRALGRTGYSELFAAIGTIFGSPSDDQFNLPDFSGRLPVGTDPNATAKAKADPYPIGTSAGEETVMLIASDLPEHTHALSASSDNATTNQVSAIAAPASMADAVNGFYVTRETTPGDTVVMAAGTIDPGVPAVGHPNMMPWLALNFIIAAQPTAWDCFDETCRADGLDVFIGEVRMFGFDYAPAGWASCDGSAIDMATNWALQCVIAETYGDGKGTGIVLPDLAGTTMIGAGPSAGPTPVTTPRTLGFTGGANSVVLTLEHTPAHPHNLHAAILPPRGGAALTPSDGDWLGSTSRAIGLFTDQTNEAGPMAEIVAMAGKGDMHENRQPYLAVGFCIATEGVFPLPG